MNYEAINILEKFGRFSDRWAPRIIAELNDYQLKLARLQGEFIWHSHGDTDEAFVVIEGEMAIEFRDGRVDLRAGELFVVPRGTEHKPVAHAECLVLLIEPAGVVNTGDAGGAMTAAGDVWI